jgi:outer membrane protein
VSTMQHRRRGRRWWRAAGRCVSATLTLVLVAGLPMRPAEAQAPVTIGLVLDGPHRRVTDVRTRLEAEITAVMGRDRPIRMDSEHEFVGDWSPPGIRAALARAMDDPAVDLVVVLGVIGPRLAADMGPLPKPTIGAAVLEPFALGFPPESVAVANRLHYVSPQFANQPLAVFRDVFMPKRVAVIAPEGLLSVAPGFAERLRGSYGLEGAWVIPASADPEATVALIPAEADGVYLLPVMRWSDTDLRAAASALGARRLPSFSWAGVDDVRSGILAAVTTESLHDRLPRWVAVTVEALTRERPAGVVPSAFLVREQLTLNRTVLQSVGVSPRWRALVDAQYVGEDSIPASGRLTLASAIEDALAANLDLSAASRGLEAGAASVRLAGAPLLPQVGIGASSRSIGGNILASAEPYASSGALTGNAGFSLSLYDDHRWANYSIERSLQSSREYTFGARQLDIAQAAAVGYLVVLGQRTVVRIQRANLDLTRSNLEIARIREATGGGRLAEVYRWQTQMAQAQDALVRATTTAALGEQELNRLLHRPLTGTVTLVSAVVDDPVMMGDAARVGAYVDNPATFWAFRRFLVAEAMERSPELLALDAQTAAFERQRVAANRSFWLPSFSLEGGGLYRFSQWGDTQSSGNSGLWTVALVGRYPLFTGLSRFAESDRASAELERITLERAATQERVDQRVGAAALNLRGALVGLEVAREAAEAARRNYALTEESYREGVGAIIMVLDAQNVALAADLRAATAAYEVLVSVADLQRAVGRFDLFGSAEARDAFFRRLDVFFAEAGVEVRR